MMPMHVFRLLREKEVLSPSVLEEFDELRKVRNNLAHGFSAHPKAVTHTLVERVQRIIRLLEAQLKELPPKNLGNG
jgi:uncharacterized protein YutE (UPF0331/DUF86 family)